MPISSTPTPARTPAPQGLDLSKIRHDLRTPINHILGYCEMLQEEDAVPPDFQNDLQKIHAGGKHLLSLITEYFDEETFETKHHDLQQLCHELRTPVNHIIGYTELLEELAEERGLKAVFSDLDKIREAARIWLELMEEYLVTPRIATVGRESGSPGATASLAMLQPGIGFTAPVPRNPAGRFPTTGRLLVVDDDAGNRDMLSRRLVRLGHNVSVARTGIEALHLLRNQPVDLVLLDLVMPGLDGYQVLSKIKADPALAEIPVVMISALDQENSVARCIEAGAEDYVPKPFNSAFLRARIGACLDKRYLREKERRTYEALLQSQQHLAAELAEAAVYVHSLLPAPLLEEPVRIQWRFQPSAQLGGDIFGYHWIGSGRLAIYLLDVSGHGVGAALLSVSVLNLLRAQSLPETDFGNPAEVLGRLNRVFQMERQNNLLFTLWYGVFDLANLELTYASGGHPPAILTGAAFPAGQRLGTGGRVIGCDPEAIFRNETHPVPRGSTLYIFSDGAYEIAKPDGRLARLDDFVDQIIRPQTAGVARLDELVAWARDLGGGTAFEDDLSLLEVAF